MSATTLITNTLPASEPCRLCDAQIGEPHSAACPMGERYRQVQAMGGVPMPKMTREQAAAFLADDIDPALYGLPQDSEIGPEVYPAPEELASPAGWDVAEPGPEQEIEARPVVSVVNVGSDLEPRTRLAVDGTIVARGTATDLEPLRLELEESPAKAIALRDHCREREARP